MEDETKEERDHESYLRWQKLAIEQLGNAINLFLTLSGAVMAFAVKIMMDSKATLSPCVRWMFHASLMVVSLSILFALAANITRASDFRHTRGAALASWKGNKEEHTICHEKARRCGDWTWCFFHCQTVAFGLGALLLCLSIWIGYGHQI